ncbi:hypothetical protein ACEWK1_02830 [Metabacillus sp. YM-086]|uniref:hypothetical protein n=1 Tax=Metabacillus sp. YM-086 TaxID=3341729 RepID=UPI003A85CF20
MKIIQCLADIEAIKVFGEVPVALMKEIEQDFLGIYEMENIEEELFHFRLSMRQALFVLEKGDDVLGKLDQPFQLEYMERLVAEDLTFYRCAIRNDYELQLYYSVVGTHDQEVEDWLLEQSQDGW